MGVWNGICYLVFLLFSIPNCRQHPLNWLRWPRHTCETRNPRILVITAPTACCDISSVIFVSSHIALKITKGCYGLPMHLTCDWVPQSHWPEGWRQEFSWRLVSCAHTWENQDNSLPSWWSLYLLKILSNLLEVEGRIRKIE